MTLPGTLSSEIGCCSALGLGAFDWSWSRKQLGVVKVFVFAGPLTCTVYPHKPSVNVCSSRGTAFYTVTNVPKASTWKALAF